MTMQGSEMMKEILLRQNSEFTPTKIGYNFEMREKEKSRKSLIYGTLSKALQDGLEPTTP